MGWNAWYEMGIHCSFDSQFDILQRHSVCSKYTLRGNDIGLVPCGELFFHIKFTIANLSSMLPGTSLVWSSILPRMKWRYSENIRNMEISRKRVNRGVRSYLFKIGGYVIRHPDFDNKHPALLEKVGVHLSFIANDIFLNQIQGALETFLKYPHCLVYPFN